MRACGGICWIELFAHATWLFEIRAYKPEMVMSTHKRLNMSIVNPLDK